MTKAELLKKHPFTALSLLNQDLIRSSSAENVDCEITVLYSASYRRKKDEGWKLTYCAELLTNVGDSLPDPEYCQSAMNFGKFLSRHFVVCSIVPYRDRIRFSTPVEYLHHNADQPTPLLSFLFGLATGENRIDKATVKQPIVRGSNQTAGEKAKARNTQSQFFAITAAADLLKRSIDDNPDQLQLMLREQFAMENISRKLADLLSAIRLLPSRNMMNRALCNSVVQQMAQEIKIGPRDYYFCLSDNINFSELANHDPARIGHRACTTVIDCIIPYECLVQDGFYSTNQNTRLSRVPSNTWEALNAEEGSAARIVRLKPIDYRRMSECVLEDILQSGQDYLSGKFEVGSVRTRSARRINRATHMSLVESMQLADMSNGDMEDMLTFDTSDHGNDARQHIHPIYSVQVIQADLARTSTILSIGDYVMAVNKKQLDAWESSEDNVPGTDSPVAEMGAATVQDGQPATQFMIQVARDNISPNPRFRRQLHPFFGGFHTLLKLLNASGQMFKSLFISMGGTYRKSIQRILYILFPHDPRQREAEEPEMLQALYAHANKQLAIHIKRKPSPAEVHKHMMQRAKKYPVCMLFVLWSRYASVAKMMRMSERIGPHGDIELFFSTLRFALHLFTVTHKTDYVRLICDFFMWWECASPAQRKLYELYLFTQRTSTGGSIFSDLFVEGENRLIRQDCGKVARKGLDCRLEQSSHRINKIAHESDDIIQQLRTGGQVAKKSRSKKTVDTTETSPVLKVFAFFEESHFFHVSKRPIVGYNKDKSPIYADEGSNALPNGEFLNMARVPGVIVEAGDRAENYIQFNNINTQNKVSRSEEDVPLKSIPLTGADVAEALAKYIDKQVSVNRKRVAEVMNVDELVCEVESLLLTLNEDYEVDPPEPEITSLKSKKKGWLVEKLIGLRNRLYKLDPEAKDHIAYLSKLRFEEENQPNVSLEEALALPIYQLSDEILNEA
jgi:hypothetical protein